MLTEQLRSDLTAAMKRRDEVAVAAIRMALAAVSEASVAGREARQLTDDEVLRILGKEVKRRDEAAEAFRGGGRDDRAERELAERAVLAAYLPAPLTGEEVEALVAEVLAEGGFSEPKDIGPAMKAVTARIAGRADGRAVAALVKSRLAG